MSGRLALGLAALAGLLHIGGFAPFELYALQVGALAALFWLCREASGRAVAARAFAFAFVWLGVGLWWLYISLHDFGHLPAPLAALAVALLAAFLAGYYALALGLAARWSTGPWRWLALVGAWLLAELARGSWFSGFPWIASGYAHAAGPLAAWAPWVGVYGLALLAAVMAAGAASGWRLGLLALLGPLLVGLALPQSFTTPTGTTRLSLVQPSIPQDQKFDPDRFQAHLDTLAELVGQARGDAVITPESVVPLPLVYLGNDYLDRLASHGRPVLLGSFLGTAEQGYVNSLVAVGTAPYDYGKHHLLPFGEVIPPGFEWFVRALHIPMDSQARGQHTRPWVVGGQRLRPLICFEDLFGEEIVDSLQGPKAATVLVNVSNLAWFGSFMSLDQHLQFSQMRALEFQRPVVRSTNTGVTAALDHHGRVQARLPALARGVLEVEVEGREGSTPYARWLAMLGLAPLWAAGGLLVAVAAWRTRAAPGRRP